MFRILLLGVTLAALLLPAAIVAQEATPRTLELRLAGLSRGYLRPLKATAERLRGVKGISSVEMMDSGGGLARFRVVTTLDNAGLASALQLQLVGANDTQVLLAGDNSPRARRCEARWPVMKIVEKISAQPRPSRRGDGEALFETGASMKDKMTRLGLDEELLRGVAYGPSDYHIVENFDGTGAEYRVWAGKTWESVYVPVNEGRADPPVENPNPDSPFVGMRLFRSPWQGSLSWVDAEGLRLSSFGVERDAVDGEGVLQVRQLGDWIESVASALAAYRVRLPKAGIDDLPSGRGWQAISRLSQDSRDDNDSDLQNWEYMQALLVEWRKADNKLVAVLTVHEDYHPFHLKAEVDTQLVIEDYEDKPEEERKKLRRAELGKAFTWLVAPEAGPEVFERRRSEARANSVAIMKAIAAALKAHTLEQLCGKLDDTELFKRLGIKLDENEFKAGEYVIARQLMGDVEISVGSPRTGGRLWMLASTSEGKVLRSNQ